MDKEVRTVLKSAVARCRRLLEEAVAQVLQGQFGIHPDGTVEDETRMGHLCQEDLRYRSEILCHLEHIRAAGFGPRESVGQLTREAAFTHLNRLCAFKMMEARGLIREAVSRGLRSQGFMFYLADHPEDEAVWAGGEQYVAYRHYLRWLGESLSEEVGALFSPQDLATRLFPPQRTLEEVLEVINSPELEGIWGVDETIGWIYQYFTPKELRDRSRKESSAPRNSYELAFRNQFYTPRYVVEFLTDNTLGRMWYEMRRGDTALVEKCRYLVPHPGEPFPVNAAGAGDASSRQQDVVAASTFDRSGSLPHRRKKDPREIKILDPACGSGHFLLYCFDLLQTIYEEAYDDIQLGPALKKDYPSREEYRKAIPGLILRHNVHGIDIDLRATQIAGLALWLKAQRAFQELGLRADERPRITRANVVCAEPMPGEAEMLEQFAATLRPALLGQLLRVIFNKMRLAGEAGSLLKIEEEISEVVTGAKLQWLRQPQYEQGILFPEAQRGKQLPLFDVSGITDERFWEEAEARVMEALRDYADAASNGPAFHRRLFAEDAAQGFAFIDLCRQKFDVVLMNPPFGEFSASYKKQARDDYPNTYNDIFAAFVERFLGRLRPRGLLGAITSRTGFFLTSFRRWREEVLLKQASLRQLVDLGAEVMDDAMVESAAYCLERIEPTDSATFVRLLGLRDRDRALAESVRSIRAGKADHAVFFVPQGQFRLLEEAPFVYWVPSTAASRLASLPAFEPSVGRVRQGLVTGDNPRFVRALWEVPPTCICGGPSVSDAFQGAEEAFRERMFPLLASGCRWVPHVMAGASQPWFSPLTVAVNWEDDGAELKNFKDASGKLRSRPQNTEFYFRPGFSWTRRAVRFVPYLVPAGTIPTASRYMAFPNPGREFEVLGVAASNVASAILRFRGEKFAWPNFLVENVKALPWPALLPETVRKLEERARDEVAQRRRAYQNHEPFQEFTAPEVCFPPEDPKALAYDRLSLLGADLDREVAAAYGLTPEEQALLERDLREAILAQHSQGDPEEDEEEDADSCADFVLPTDPRSRHEALLSYVVGCCFGRWDIRIGRDPSLAPALPDPFEPLPVCPPGMLIGPDGLPATSVRIVSEEWLRARPDANRLPPTGSVGRQTITESEYPIPLAWDGIVPDDPEHRGDLVRRVRDALAKLMGDGADRLEQESCQMLGVRTLRDYFRKPGKGGFWTDHVRRYSKSSRKAPIYWLLQSARGSYALWLYYHRLDGDTLFKALLNYVEPKVRLEASRLEQLLQQRQAAGTGGREAKQLEKQIARQEALLLELEDFQQKLRGVADLHLKPDLNDGVLLNIAPLWELVPWAEAKKCWEELLAGRYEWSSIGRQLREKGLVR